MSEIKLNNAEQLKTAEWKDVQTKLYSINFKGLKIEQWQRNWFVCYYTNEKCFANLLDC